MSRKSLSSSSLHGASCAIARYAVQRAMKNNWSNSDGPQQLSKAKHEGLHTLNRWGSERFDSRKPPQAHSDLCHKFCSEHLMHRQCLESHRNTFYMKHSTIFKKLHTFCKSAALGPQWPSASQWQAHKVPQPCRHASPGWTGPCTASSSGQQLSFVHLLKYKVV